MTTRPKTLLGLPVASDGKYSDDYHFTGEKFSRLPRFSDSLFMFDVEDKPEPLDPKFKQEWLAALRSDNYHQAKEALAKKMLLNEDDIRYCCLGVACKIMDVPYMDGPTDDYGNISLFFNHELNYLPHYLADSVKFSRNHQRVLASLNDAGWTFAQIADLIEEVF